MLTPAYRLTIGDKVVDTTHEARASTLLALTVVLDIDTPADSATLALGQVDGLKPKPDEKVKIELGYADDTPSLTLVMTGTVGSIDPGLTTNRVIVYSGCSSLLSATSDQTYESKTAGAIVKDLAARAKVDVATVEDGSTFPAYVVDGRRSAYRHMLDLARLCGHDLYVNPEGKLVFQKYVGGRTVHVLEYAKQLVELDVERQFPIDDKVEAWGESPGGGGVDRWAWLTKDFSGNKGSAGEGTGTRLLERPALRTRTAAATAASAAEADLRHGTVSGSVRTWGLPQITLGDAIRFRGAPDDQLNGVFAVRRVVHRITKQGGFRTDVEFRSAS